MTVPTDANRVVYLGSGILGPFDINFPFLADADVVVIKTLVAAPFTETTLTLNVDYTLTGALDPDGGQLQLSASHGALSADYKLTIYRDPAVTQETDYGAHDGFPAETHERALDKLTMIGQRFKDIFGRSFRLSDGDVTGIDPIMPTPVDDAFLKVKSDGSGLEWGLAAGVLAVSAFGQTLLNAANAAAARALLLITAYADTLLLAADAAAARILLGFSAIAAKGDLFAGTAANTIGTLTVGSEGAALIADPAQSKGMQWVRLGAGSVRQSVLSAALDANGYNAAITTGAGLRPGLDANPTPMVMAFAAGFGAGGAQDLTATLSADVADILGADLNASNTAFIFADWASLTSVTWSKCLTPPQYGYAFDRTQGALLNFEAADASTTMVDDFGNTWTASGNAQIDTAQFKFGTSSLLLDGTGDFITSTNFTTMGDGSWEFSLWFRINALPGVGVNSHLVNFTNASNFGVQLYLNNTGGTVKLGLNASSNGSSNDIVSGNGTNTTWTLNQWHKARVVFDALAGTYRVYLSLNGAAETQDQTTSSTARVCGLTNCRLGAFSGGGSEFNGWIDAFRFIRAATVTATETPGASAPAITDYPYHWFSIPEMKMYEVTSASASAGVNPTMTRRDRLFVAEADTSGAAVTAVRNYALRGRYVSALTAWATTARTSFSHNIGVPGQFLDLRMKFQCVTGENGWVVGDTQFYAGEDNATAGMSVDTARNACGVSIAGSFPVGSTKTGSGRAGLTTTAWKVIASVAREF